MRPGEEVAHVEVSIWLNWPLLVTLDEEKEGQMWHRRLAHLNTIMTFIFAFCSPPTLLPSWTTPSVEHPAS